jgi:hypothetical protein
MKAIIFILPFLFYSCLETSVAPDETLPAPTAIKIGTKVYLSRQKVDIGFKEVEHDSRCPDGAVCIWAGEAKANLWILKPGREIVTVSAIIPGMTKWNDDSPKYLIDTIGVKFKVLGLNPYPEAGKEINPQSYFLLIELIK